ncbi:hypothetical protein ACFYOT_24860 [Saccharothrix saharensis]|uniref:hypothetical protein n=1 Tax=Saccharothrix saharensis TaxID=571190 RepID=UPI003676188B
MHRNRTKAAVTLGVLLLATACGTPVVTESQPEERKPELHFSLSSSAKNYHSFEALGADSAVVVEATAGSATNEELSGIPTTVTEVRVDRVIAGRATSDTLPVLQFGDASVLSPETSSLLREGHRYLLFLHAHQLTPGVDTGRFLITGDQGAYELADGRYDLIGAPSSALPRSLTAEDAVAIAQRTG